MSFSSRQFGRALTACLLIAVFAIPTQMLAQTHVVNPADLQKEMVSATQVRQQNLENLENFLSTPEALQAMKSSQIDPARVKSAIPLLSDEELAGLSSRATRAQADFAAGTLSNRDLIWIVVGVVVLILIIVAVR